jgi:hypothetical protein
MVLDTAKNRQGLTARASGFTGLREGADTVTLPSSLKEFFGALWSKKHNRYYQYVKPRST